VSLNLDILPAETRLILQELLKQGLPECFYLIGGTALAIQSGYRPSEDIDFATLSETISGSAVSTIINILVANGHSVKLAMSQSKIVQAKINGRNLLDHVRDYVVDGKVKLTFVALTYPESFQIYLKKLILNHSEGAAGVNFKVLSVAGIFATKSILIEKRIKSRDLFDIDFMLCTGKFNIGDLLQLTSTFGENGEDYAKAVLTGDIPLDLDDEGFFSLGIDISMKDIYTRFTLAINAYEVELAKNISRNLKPISV